MVNFYNERTVRWNDGTVVLIDQRKLPNRFTHIHCTDHVQVAKAIRNMNVRGAPAIGVAAAMGLALTANNSKAKTKTDLMTELKVAGRELTETRPTAANLSWGVKRIYNKVLKADGDMDFLRQMIIREAECMGDEDVANCKEIGRNGSSLLEDGDTVLTHCKWF
jgi:methylthioribose-1-phosphate isomerase